MIMKKIFAAFVALAFSIPSFAQYSSGGFTFDEENVYYGVRIGVNVASLSGDTKDGFGVNMGSKAGLSLAGVVGLRVSNTAPVFLESGLYYSERGAKKDKIVLTYNNLEIPVLVKYGFKTSDLAILPFFGPAFSQAVSGKYKIKGTDFEVGAFDEKEWVGLKRFNMGIKLGCGVEYDMLYLEAGYHFGVTNMCKHDNISMRSNSLFVNFGVNF